MVDQLKAEHNVDLEWRPFYLRPDTPPEGMDLPDYILRARANGSEERLKSMAAVHGMEFNSTKRIYNTRLAHEATEYARVHGKLNEFHKVVFRQVYADGQDISRWDVLRTAAEVASLDAEDLQKVVESGKYTAKVAEQVQWAYQIGVTGVPTYVINDRYAVVGAQPYDVFKNALEQISKLSS
ncbi:2-hydroxychromene-2-carboxylate isomerase [Anaerolineae bacterium]|nr:2-hydroxychromene-2-carboxylate isomerase [Anaerolineae bacterium]